MLEPSKDIKLVVILLIIFIYSWVRSSIIPIDCEVIYKVISVLGEGCDLDTVPPTGESECLALLCLTRILAFFLSDF